MLTFDEFKEIINNIHIKDHSPKVRSSLDILVYETAIALKNGSWVHKDGKAILHVSFEEFCSFDIVSIDRRSGSSRQSWHIEIDLNTGETSAGGSRRGADWYEISIVFDASAAMLGKMPWKTGPGPYQQDLPINWGIRRGKSVRQNTPRLIKWGE